MKFRIIVSSTLFDDKSGKFMGRTTRGTGITIGAADIVNNSVRSVELNTELFYVTTPRKKTLVIAELVLQCLIDRNNGQGIVTEEIGLGWAALPAADEMTCGRGKMMTSIRSGTPRLI